MELDHIAAAVRDIPDFPKPGIVFKDISPVIQDGQLLRDVTDAFAELHSDTRIDAIAAVDARGFIFGGALAYKLGVGLAMIRKKGKLPATTVSAAYELEYGMAEVELHEDAAHPGANVVLLDDVLATGGTAAACVGLIEQIGARVVSVDFFLELDFLSGRDRLAGYRVNSLIHIPG